MSEAQKRQFFRVIYPAHERPKVIIARKPYEIMDLSEGGVKIFVKNPTLQFEVEKLVEGNIIFADKVNVAFKGKILRVHEDFVVVRTSTGVPLQRIMGEQRYLIAKYGTLQEKL